MFPAADDGALMTGARSANRSRRAEQAVVRRETLGAGRARNRFGSRSSCCLPSQERGQRPRPLRNRGSGRVRSAACQGRATCRRPRPTRRTPCVRSTGCRRVRPSPAVGDAAVGGPRPCPFRGYPVLFGAGFLRAVWVAPFGVHAAVDPAAAGHRTVIFPLRVCAQRTSVRAVALGLRERRFGDGLPLWPTCAHPCVSSRPPGLGASWRASCSGCEPGLPRRAERQPVGSSGMGWSGRGLPECGAPRRPVPASSVSGISGSGSDSSLSSGRAASSADSQGSSVPLPVCWSGISLGVGSGPGGSGRGSLTALSLPRWAGTARGYPGGWERCLVFVAVLSVPHASCHSGRAVQWRCSGPKRAGVCAAIRT